MNNKKHSEQTKQKISLSKKGKLQSELTKSKRLDSRMKFFESKRLSSAMEFVGKKFGYLTVIKPLEYNYKNHTHMFLCKCDCGNECIKSRNILISVSKKRVIRCSLKCKLNAPQNGTNNPNYKNGNGILITYTCKCGNKRTAKGGDFRFDSEYVCGDCSKKSRFGHKHPNYKHGNYSRITDNGIKKILTFRKFPEYKEWQKAVKAKDKYICQICFSNGELVSHHLKPWAELLRDNNIKNYEEAKNCKELWDINNGVTFCKSCHSDVHFIAKEYGEVK